MTPVIIDPDNNEASAILRYGDIESRRVLDVGCGNGWLTCEYADRSAEVVGIDPDLADVRIAISERPEALGQKVHFLNARAEEIPFPEGYFDTALFTSSL